jgi:phosphohistidine swiveling domain-containing protein
LLLAKNSFKGDFMSIVNFSIEGKFLTNHFRNLCLEGEWNKAINQLKESLVGIDLDTVVSILSGKNKLVGVNDLFLEEDLDSSEYVKEILSLYSKFYFTNGRWYKISATINTIKPGQEYIYERANIYVPGFDHGEFIEDTFCIFEETKELPPFWLEGDLKEKSLSLDYVTSYGVFENELEFYNSERDLVRNIVQLHSENGLLCSYSEIDFFMEEDFVYEEILQRSRISRKIKNRKEQEYIQSLKDKVISQAEEKGGFMTVVGDSGTEYKIAKNPFLIWAQNQYPELNINVDWELVSPSGLKMRSDNPYHTDFVLSSSVDLEESYTNKDFLGALYDALFEELPVEMVVYSGEGIITGQVMHIHDKTPVEDVVDKIIVIPYAGVEFFEHAKVAKLVIAASGGPTSHLALNANEYNIHMVLLQNAFDLSESIVYTFDLDSNKISF